MNDTLPSSPVPVSAYRPKPGSVTYVYRDGSTTTLHGDRPYRDNNPGDLRFPGRNGLQRAKDGGGIGLDGGFAIFPSVAAGERAIDQMINKHAARKQTLLSFLTAYAPPGENNTAAYISVVTDALRAKPSDTLASLSDQQRSLFAQTIMLQEGGRTHGHEASPPTMTDPRSPKH